MVKQIDEATVIPGLTPEEVFQRVYGQPEAVQRYHAECNDDPNAVVGEWCDGQREVVFSTRLNLPAAIKRAIGIETLTVREVSTREPDDGDAIVITSKPILDFTGGSKFTTSSLIRLSPQGHDCLVEVTITCEAAGPWGLVGTIEETMAAEARTTIGGYLAFARRWCAENGPEAGQPTAAAAEANGFPSPVPRLLLPNGAPASDLGEDEEDFYDAVPATPGSVTSISGVGSRVSYTVELQSLSRRLQAVETAIQQLQAQAQQQQQQQQQRPRQQQPATSMPPPAAASSGRSSWMPSAGTLAVAAAAAGIAAAIALEYGQRAGVRQATTQLHGPSTIS